MKHNINKIFVALTVLIMLGTGCSKSELDLSNPNQPGMPSINTEEGILRFGLGIYSKPGLEYWWLSQSMHNAMGDQVFISAGNFSWRWANQPTSITLDNGTVVTPPQGGAQGVELKNRNDRSFGTDNAFYPEWLAMYLVNNQANLLLQVADGSELVLAGNADAKKNTLRAWAYWWKGYAYSRIGSLYVAGIINNEVDKSNSEFKAREAIITEANANFDKAALALDAITDASAYTAVMDRLIPSFTKLGRGGVLTQAEWKRQMNTYKARNILVNKKVADLTPAELNQILTLTAAGVQQSDKIFTNRSANANDVVSQTAWTPWRILSNTWEFLSERWVQEFKAGDARRTRNVVARATPIVNNSGRGLNYGTRWTLNPIETGGDYVSQQAGLAELPIATTYEENALTRAEALIRLNGAGQLEQGLQLIDQVRQFQNASLPAVAGTGLTQAQALAELYSERRIALFLKGTAFYDYRRFGFACKGCARTGTVVLSTNSSGTVVNTNATILYNYMDYFDVPLNEIDFNTPSTSSAPVTFPY